MHAMTLGGVLLLLLRLSIFPFFFWAVWQLLRRRQWLGPQIVQTAGVMGAQLVVGAATIACQSLLLGGRGGILNAILDVPLLVLLCGAMGLCCYAGLQLAGPQGYWRRRPTGEGLGRMVAAGLVVLVLIAGGTLGFSKVGGVPLAVPALGRWPWPTGSS